jgi:integrator complex subunit 1
VRKLVAANLEKWLQSPALAGLARSLFISTVNHIKIVDPPLNDDLRVIDSIVGMNLKSNQVSQLTFTLLAPTLSY